MVCNGSELGAVLEGRDAASTRRLQRGLCALPGPTLRALGVAVLSQLDLPRLLAVSPGWGARDRDPPPPPHLEQP